jgi:SecD/SecF fusion protein
MKLKGLVWFFTIALILISLYQLSFTLVTRNFESNVAAKAEAKILKERPQLKDSAQTLDFAVKNKTRLMLDSLGTEEAYPLLGTSYKKCKEQELNLGLDLQGGMNVVLEVGIDKLVSKLSNNPSDGNLKNAIKAANAKKANSGDDFITLFEQAYSELNPEGKLAPLFVKNSTEKLSFNSSNSDVIAMLRTEADEAFERTANVITKRIDQFGVSQPTLNAEKDKGIITVELAGVQNPEKVRKYLQATANLEFWETYSVHEIVQNIIDADEALKTYNDSKGGAVDTDELTTTETPAEVVTTDSGDSTKTTKKDDGSVSSLLGGDVNATGGDDSASLANLTEEEQMAKARNENPLRFYMGQIMQPGTDQKTGQIINNCQVSVVRNIDIPKLKKLFAMDVVKREFPRDLFFAFGPVDKRTIPEEDKRSEYSFLYSLRRQSPSNFQAPIDGDAIDKAFADFDQTGNAEIIMQMDNKGGGKWAQLTKKNIDKPIAIVLDSMVYSAPAPRQQITGGRSSITGSFGIEEAKDVANVLKTGKLAAPAKIVQEQVVGPTLGKEAIEGGKMSFGISFLIIFILMLLYYNSGGWIANVALILNLIFTIGVLSALGASLTAAGIAGLVLTIGMAVDANVIIFERIKEELADGRSYEEAVDEGYKRSYAPVLDGHLTNLITAFVLFAFGLGPVLGFATTQIIGLFLSLFCGILVSRLFTDIMTNKDRHLKYFTGLSKKLFRTFNFKFIQWRKKAYIISGIVALLGIAAFFNGFDYGVEFSGGRSYTVRLANAVKTQDVRKDLQASFGGEFPVVKTIGNANQVNITTAYKINDLKSAEASKEVLNSLYTGLIAGNYLDKSISKEKFEKDIIVGSQEVQPTISDDLRDGAIYATIISLILITLYIFLRFRRWQYSLGTIIALLHDVLVTLAVFSFARKFVPFAMEIDQHFIAAILTVIGFSMNDTVVVFDRIREYFRKRPGSSKTEVINSAINDTMSRTIMTSLTVFLTLLVLFIFGGEVTRGFSFAMMIGVITGTYSSVFVAAPILVDLDKSDKLTKEEDKEAKIKELKEQA